jgi:drug/metabolite transporter (DMT)-like permease
VSDNPRFPPLLALIISTVAVSTASILIRLSDAPPFAIASYRMIFSTIILLPYFLFSGGLKHLRESSARDLLTLIGVGVVLALHFASWISSLSLTSVASSVIFVHIDPIIVALLSHFVFKERVNRGTVTGIFLALGGASIIALGDITTGETSLYGDFLALIGAFMLGIYILCGRRIRQRLKLVFYVTPVYAVSATALTLGSLISGTTLTSFPMREYLLFLTISIVPMILGHTLYNWTLKYLRAPLVSISLVGEPIGATLLAIIILNEVPSLQTLLGGAVTLLGIYLCARHSS